MKLHNSLIPWQCRESILQKAGRNVKAFIYLFFFSHCGIKVFFKTNINTVFIKVALRELLSHF